MTINLFLIIGAAIGVMQIYESVLLVKNGHKIISTVFFTSSLEAIWVIVCIWFIFSQEIYGLILVIPCVFIAYNIAGWISNWSMMKHAHEDSIIGLAIPSHITYMGMLSGFIYMVLNLLALYKYDT